jgi:hypothetical protein
MIRVRFDQWDGQKVVAENDEGRVYPAGMRVFCAEDAGRGCQEGGVWGGGQRAGPSAATSPRSLRVRRRAYFGYTVGCCRIYIHNSMV